MDKMYDVIIVGGGPAGLSAAIYMARAKYKVLLLEKEKIGGQITITADVVNYPGVFKTSGTELTTNMQNQAKNFGAEFEIAEVLDMDLRGDIKVLHTTKGIYQSLGVILALGANPRKLGFKGEKEFAGRGVAYCATCDGEFFSGMEVYVVGGGFAAVEEAIFLTKYASKVHVIVRKPEFSCAKTVSDKLEQEKKITVQFNTEVISVSGAGTLSRIAFKNNITDELSVAENQNGFGVFVFAGYVPNTNWVTDDIEKVNSGYILTDENRKTNLDGVYAAGDVCVKNLRQVVTAVSDGAIASTSLEKYVEAMHGKLNLSEFERKEIEQVAQETAQPHSEAESVSTGFLSDAIREQLASVFAKFESTVTIKAFLDESQLGSEISGFLAELAPLTEKVNCEKEYITDKLGGKLLPYMELFFPDGRSSGIRFHAVPGGHELNSFVIALYNVAGPGQATDADVLEKIKGITAKINIKVMLSLSCTMCPEVVMATQKIAVLSENVTAEAIDVMHFPAIKEQYKIMSVPCMVINDEAVYFGKKSINEILDILT